MKKTKVFVLSTTHWDREWYQPYEQYRFRLVQMMDELIDTLDKEKDYRCFHFDGQTIILSDYLQIRPENKQRLEALVKSGKILIGPWYTMPDEFLIGGEGLIRNLQKGHEQCKQYGVKACNSGYICDIFGHNSQMPQIFKGFGIDNAALFRGRAGYEKTEFLWQGSDGSTVLVNKLHPDYAYSSFFFVARWPFENKEYDMTEMAERVDKYLKEESGYFSCDAHLMMDGVDHMSSERKIPVLLNELNQRLPDYEFIHSNFEDYLSYVKANAKDLQTVKGVMYDIADEGVNNSLLKNVLSSMVQLKQDNSYCENRLPLVAEPLQFFEKTLCDTSSNHEGFFRQAWDYVLQNQPHDSICGCSVTATHLDCENRFKRTKEIISTLEADIISSFSKNICTKGKGKDGAFLVFNPSQGEKWGTLVVPFEIPSNTHQNMFRFYDADDREVPYNILSRKTSVKKVYGVTKLVSFPAYDKFELVLELDLPSYGYQVLTYELLKQEKTGENYNWKFSRYDAPNRYLGSMMLSSSKIDNGCLIVEINGNGTLKVTDKETGKTYQNLLTFEDCGDAGDGWNYVKPQFDSCFLSTCSQAELFIEADFPNFTRFKIINTFKLPILSDWYKRSAEREDFTVESTVTVTKNSKTISVKTEVKNHHEGHRLRVIFPTELKTETFKTLLPFDLYEWQIKKQSSEHTKEPDTGVNPNQGVITMTEGENSFTLYNQGLYEVSVFDREDKAIALTLFRSFPNEVSELESDMGKMKRNMTFEYAMDFGRHTDSELIQRSNAFKSPLLFSECKKDAEGILDTKRQLLKITGNAVLSALYCVEDKNYIRIFDANGFSEGAISFTKPIKKAVEVGLNYSEIQEAKVTEGSIEYHLNNKQIKTYRFEL